MTSTNKFRLLSLAEVFGQGNNTFHVPNYQRGYSWEDSQREDLISDIGDLLSHKRRHFGGTIVVTNHTDARSFAVVDGQQRLTSLILLLNELLRKCNTRGIKSLDGEPLKEVEKIYIADKSVPGNAKLRFNPQDEYWRFWRKLLLQDIADNPGASTKAEQNMLRARKQFAAWLDGEDDENLGAIFNAVTVKFGFLMYAAERTSEVGVMFEVINNRGKPLSELEKLKNYLLYFSERNNLEQLQRQISDTWPSILRKLSQARIESNDEEDSFLRNCWIVFAQPQPRNVSNPSRRLKEACPPHDIERAGWIADFVQFLDNVADIYTVIRAKKLETPTNKEERYLQRISLHPSNASVLPLLIAVLTRRTSNTTLLLDTIEKLNFRFYVAELASRSDSGQKELFQYAYDFYHQNIDEKGLLANLVTFINTNAGIERFIDELQLSEDSDYDFYNWRGLKFFLASYEEYLREDKKELNSRPLAQMLNSEDPEHRNDFFHREHVWAKEECSYTKEHPAKLRLGNFILLKSGLNKRAYNAQVQIKLDIYSTNDPNTWMISKVKDDWNQALAAVKENRKNHTRNFWLEVHEKFVSLREARYFDFARNRWALQKQ